MRYYLRRVAQSFLVFLIAITVAFALYRMLPYGPVEIMKVRYMQDLVNQGSDVSEAQIRRVNNLVQLYTGIDPGKPWYIAYFEYLTGILFHLDFGRSIFLDRPVFNVLFEKMPWSLFISIYGFALGVSVSLLFGALMAYTEGSKFDVGMTLFTVVNTAIPYYVVAILLLIVFGFQLEWFPTAGRYNTELTPGANLPFIISVARHGFLPIAAGFVASFGGGLAFRGNCIREKGKGYVRVGRLRGISRNRLAVRYIGRNSLLPIYTSMMMGIAGLFSSSILLEYIFNYQAMGLVTFQALQNRDYPLLMGAFLFFTAITLIGILIADLTYGIIDPRVKSGDERETY